MRRLTFTLLAFVLVACGVPRLAAQEPKLRTTLDCKSDVICMAISPDGKTLATGLDDGTTRLWDLTTGKPSGTLKGSKPPGVVEGADWPVTALAFGKEGKTLATGTSAGVTSTKGEVKLWDVVSQKIAKTYPFELGSTIPMVFSLAFTKDGKALVASSPGTLVVWDVTQDKKPRLFLVADDQGAEDYLTSVAISPDGKTVVAGNGIGSPAEVGIPAVMVWDMASGKRTATFKELKGKPFSVAFSPDGKTVATTGSEGIAVHLLDLAGGKTVTFKGAKEATTCSVAFSPDGKTVAVGTGDPADNFLDRKKECEVVLWNVASGKSTAILHGHKGIVRSVAFGHDGRILATAGTDGTVRLWDIPDQKKPR